MPGAFLFSGTTALVHGLPTRVSDYGAWIIGALRPGPGEHDIRIVATGAR